MQLPARGSLDSAYPWFVCSMEIALLAVVRGAGRQRRFAFHQHQRSCMLSDGGEGEQVPLEAAVADTYD